MSDRFKPTNHGEVEKLVAWAVSEDEPLELVGAGSKRGLGRPVRAPHTLDLSGLAGVTMYEPEELVLSAGPGTPMREIEALLATNNQALAFEPPDYGPLFGTSVGGTLGGVVAGNLSGPRRIKAGAARDHVLGLCAVSGRGETFKTGGRVVKNVTGYDLCKLMTGFVRHARRPNGTDGQGIARTRIGSHGIGARPRRRGCDPRYVGGAGRTS